MDKVKTGALIREARTKKKFTQSELGDLVGVTNKAVSRWENGESFPDVCVIEKLSEVLDISIQDIVTGGITVNEYKEEKMENVFSDVLHSMSSSVKQNPRKPIFNMILIVVQITFVRLGSSMNFYFPGLYEMIGGNSWAVFPVMMIIFFLIMMLCCRFILRSLPDAKHRIFEKRSILPLASLALGMTLIPVLMLLSGNYSSTYPDKHYIVIGIVILLPCSIAFLSFINELSMNNFSLYKLIFSSSALFLLAGYRNECNYMTTSEILFRNIHLISVFIIVETALMILFIRKRIYR